MCVKCMGMGLVRSLFLFVFVIETFSFLVWMFVLYFILVLRVLSVISNPLSKLCY